MVPTLPKIKWKVFVLNEDFLFDSVSAKNSIQSWFKNVSTFLNYILCFSCEAFLCYFNESIYHFLPKPHLISFYLQVRRIVPKKRASSPETTWRSRAVASVVHSPPPPAKTTPPPTVITRTCLRRDRAPRRSCPPGPLVPPRRSPMRPAAPLPTQSPWVGTDSRITSAFPSGGAAAPSCRRRPPNRQRRFVFMRSLGVRRLLSLSLSFCLLFCSFVFWDEVG